MSTSYCHVYINVFRLTYSFIHEFFLFWCTTLLICKSFTLSLLALNLPVSQILSRVFTSSSRTSFTDYCRDHFVWATRFLFVALPYFSFLCRAQWAQRRRNVQKSGTAHWRITPLPFLLSLPYLSSTPLSLLIGAAQKYPEQFKVLIHSLSSVKHLNKRIWSGAGKYYNL